MNAITIAKLLSECDARGIRLAAADGGKLEIDAPQEALTDSLLRQLRAAKSELLEALQPQTPATVDAEPAALAGDCPEETDSIDPGEIPACPTCGSLDAWHSVAGDLYGRTPGRWRCEHCDPPTASRWLLAKTAEIRAKQERRRHVPAEPDD